MPERVQHIMTIDDEVLGYHEWPRPGKVAVSLTKRCSTQRDLSLAYTPGVARPCTRIAADPREAYRFTNKGNLVAVISNGTAVLGLGNLGPLAAKPVMEGKAVLFKRLAGIDAFDLELDTEDVDEVVRVVRALAPTFGAIALEDIRAPDCFEIEGRLRSELSIPVLHDDQHGTAIVVAAALLNALSLARKAAGEVSVVFCGAGAAAIACADMCCVLGVRRERILMVDVGGVLHAGRVYATDSAMAKYAACTGARTLADAVENADVVIGLSAGNVLTPAMLTSMAARPIVFAMANPDPEIGYETALEVRPDVLIATGRSDFPNQVNNALAFPSVFRAALDVRARTINDAMKLAAAHAIAQLAREDIDDGVLDAYELGSLHFGHDYFIPKVLDPRILPRAAAAVARAALVSGVAASPPVDLSAYERSLERLSSKAPALGAVE